MKALKVEWEPGKDKNVSSDMIFKTMKNGLKAENAPIAKKVGNIEKALKSAHKVIESEYSSGFLHHATLEPQTATAFFHNNILEVWVGTQNGES